MDGTREERGTPAAPGDGTLGGYLATHGRSPAFEAVDGCAYTVSVETERTNDLANPVLGYLVFPRWAATGAGIVGHVESPALWKGGSVRSVADRAGELTLREVQRLLNDAVDRKTRAEGGADRRAPGAGIPRTWP